MDQPSKIEKVMKNENSWYCPRFFDHVYTNVDGQYAVCCIGGSLPYTAKTTMPHEVLTSDEMDEIRWASLSTNAKKKPYIKTVLSSVHEARRRIWLF